MFFFFFCLSSFFFGIAVPESAIAVGVCCFALRRFVLLMFSFLSFAKLLRFYYYNYCIIGWVFVASERVRTAHTHHFAQRHWHDVWMIMMIYYLFMSEIPILFKSLFFFFYFSLLLLRFIASSSKFIGNYDIISFVRLSCCGDACTCMIDRYTPDRDQYTRRWPILHCHPFICVRAGFSSDVFLVVTFAYLMDSFI